MTEYFAVLDDDDRRGPFDTMQEPVALLKANSKARGHTDEQARYFFFHQSAVEQVETVDGKVECFRLGWQAREQSGREASPMEEWEETTSQDEIARKTEDDLAETHFTVAARQDAEVNEGGLVDPKMP